MALNEIHKDSIGVVLRITLTDANGAVDISGATTKQIIFTKPDGTRVAKTASFTNSGTDGKLQYAFISGDLNVVGIWSYQAYYIEGTSEYYSDIGTFKVYRNL